MIFFGNIIPWNNVLDSSAGNLVNNLFVWQVICNVS